jgi:hypothetical protein
MEYLCITIVMKKIYDDFEAAHWPYKYVMSDKSVGWGGSVVVQILTFGNSVDIFTDFFSRIEAFSSKHNFSKHHLPIC